MPRCDYINHVIDHRRRYVAVRQTEKNCIALFKNSRSAGKQMDCSGFSLRNVVSIYFKPSACQAVTQRFTKKTNADNTNLTLHHFRS